MMFSEFGQKFTQDSGILRLMDDLGNAAAGRTDTIMLGGGNPSHIPAVEACLRERMEDILREPGAFERLVGNYSAPQGDQAFRAAVAELLNRTFGWAVTEANIALTNGSQTAFFYLFNLFGGRWSDGSRKKILLPLMPEYIGYADVGITNDLFISYRPVIDYLENHIFKYRIDFDALRITPDIGAICVSRPTNPTGNVLTDQEIARLHRLAKQHNIPLIIDNAYGPPFPGIIYTTAHSVWDEDIVFCLSLSKLGLPGVRTGIVVAREEITTAISGANAILSLAPGNFGPGLVLDLMRSGDIIRLSEELIRPHYHRQALQALNYLADEMEGIDYQVHAPEGAFFLWLWFRDLPIFSQQLYERLKQRGVLIVPGHYFFPGATDEWRHRFECIRMNYAQADHLVRDGIRMIADEVRRSYQ